MALIYALSRVIYSHSFTHAQTAYQVKYSPPTCECSGRMATRVSYSDSISRAIISYPIWDYVMDKSSKFWINSDGNWMSNRQKFVLVSRAKQTEYCIIYAWYLLQSLLLFPLKIARTFATHIHNSTETELDGKLSKIQVKFDVF
jgi:hypothetical protein